MNRTTAATVTMAHRKQRKCRQNKRKTTSKYNTTKEEWTPTLTREYVKRIDKRMLGGTILMFISFMIVMIDIYL